MNNGKMKATFGLFTVAIILAKLAVVALGVFAVIWILKNPSAVGTFFGQIVAGFQTAISK